MDPDRIVMRSRLAAQALMTGRGRRRRALASEGRSVWLTEHFRARQPESFAGSSAGKRPIFARGRIAAFDLIV